MVDCRVSCLSLNTSTSNRRIEVFVVPRISPYSKPHIIAIIPHFCFESKIQSHCIHTIHQLYSLTLSSGVTSADSGTFAIVFENRTGIHNGSQLMFQPYYVRFNHCAPRSSQSSTIYCGVCWLAFAGIRGLENLLQDRGSQ